MQWAIPQKRNKGSTFFHVVQVDAEDYGNDSSNVLTNELPMNRECVQRVTTDDRRTFMKAFSTDKDKVHRD